MREAKAPFNWQENHKTIGQTFRENASCERGSKTKKLKTTQIKTLAKRAPCAHKSMVNGTSCINCNWPVTSPEGTELNDIPISKNLKWGKNKKSRTTSCCLAKCPNHPDFVGIIRILLENLKSRRNFGRDGLRPSSADRYAFKNPDEVLSKGWALWFCFAFYQIGLCGNSENVPNKAFCLYMKQYFFVASFPAVSVSQTAGCF